ncbi:putative PNPOx domain-containing protein [Mycena kentingensis (nom. inval.)]|nr:putative PNPOx domain-containing protein [Mycena kentingensis (nom. inval.)]
MALQGWHRGENAIHTKVGTNLDYSVSNLFRIIEGELPPQHAEFHSTRLSFLPVTTLDKDGRPWGSVLADKAGGDGWVNVRGYTVLGIRAGLWDGEPLLENAGLFEDGKEMLIAGIGIELSTRRRNKLAGHITKLNLTEHDLKLDLRVNQAIGNCPKYITIRDLAPHPNTIPQVAFKEHYLSDTARLPKEAIAMIHAADLVFFGTTYRAYSQDAMQFPSHLGMNHRGGRPGFIRVAPGDGRTVYMPDYSGNRFLTSLGNVEATPLASLTFIDFVSGDILYLTGDAENLIGDDAHKVMPFQKTLTAVSVTGFTLVRDAFPVRLRAGAVLEPSPYSPPIRRLAAEGTQNLFADEPTALLARIDLHAPSIATFTWHSSVELRVRAGQAVIMNMAPLVGVPQYRHMAPGKPTSVNDDSVRSWTISSVLGSKDGIVGTRRVATKEYSITLREKRGGAVTGPLFAIARKLQQVKPEALKDSTDLELKVGIVGVSGDFVLPEEQVSDAELGLEVQRPLGTTTTTVELLWIAGGIGLTPFLSMLRALRLESPTTTTSWDVRLVLSTGEPEVLIPLILDAYGNNPDVRFALDVFTRNETFVIPNALDFVTLHRSRLPADFFVDPEMGAAGRKVYLCGSPEFEKAAMEGLLRAGVGAGSVNREGFEY